MVRFALEEEIGGKVAESKVGVVGSSRRMAEAYEELAPEERDAAHRRAEQRVREWRERRSARHGPGVDDEAGFAYAGFDDESPVTAAAAQRVWRVDGVLTAAECAQVLHALRAAAARRGGWDIDRHGRYPTTDMPLGDVPEVEPLLRRRVFSRVLQPLAPHFLPEGFLPEHLEWRDAFFVKHVERSNLSSLAVSLRRIMRRMSLQVLGRGGAPAAPRDAH